MMIRRCQVAGGLARWRACNAGSSSSMVVARHWEPVRSVSAGVPHGLRGTEGSVPRVAGRRLGSRNSAVAPRDQDARCVDRDRSRRPAGLAACLRRQGHRHQRTGRRQHAVRGVLRHQAGLRLRRPEAVREGRARSRYAADEVHDAANHGRSTDRAHHHAACARSHDRVPNWRQGKNLAIEFDPGSLHQYQARDSAICNPSSRRSPTSRSPTSCVTTCWCRWG